MNSLTFYRPDTIQNILGEFDNYFGSLDSLLAPAAKIFNHAPVVDVKETDNAFIMDMELPGYDEKNIDVHVDGLNLTVASKQEEQKENKTKENKDVYLIRERRTSSFSRSFKLPENADPESVNAAFKNGVLSLEIKNAPKRRKGRYRLTPRKLTDS
jgi:HSP20 family protein